MKNDYETLAEYVLYFTRSAFFNRYLMNSPHSNFQGSYVNVDPNDVHDPQDAVKWVLSPEALLRRQGM